MAAPLILSAAPSTAISAEGAATVRKIIWRLIPFLGFIYLIAYIDRQNVSYAKLQMVGDLGLTEYAYGLGASLFFIGYFLFEVPSNVLLERVGARRWFARIMVSWGLVTIALAFTKNATMFYILRFLLGVCEAGFFPGVLYVMTLWFPFAYRAKMVGSFMIFSAVANAVGAPIGGSLLDLDGAGGYRGWQWVFLVTGVPAVLMGIVTLFYLDDRPDTARFLTSGEKSWLAGTLAAEDRAMNKTRHGNPFAALLDGRVLLMCVYYIAFPLAAYGLSYWLPTIVKGFGVSNTTNGLINVIPWVIVAVALWAVPAMASRAGTQTPYIVGPALFGAACLVLSVYVPGDVAKFAFLCGAAAGIFAGQPVLWSLPSSFLTGASAAAGLAAINSVGNLGGFIAQNVVPWIKDQTGSNEAPMLFLAACLAVGGLMTFAVQALIRRRRVPALGVPAPRSSRLRGRVHFVDIVEDYPSIGGVAEFSSRLRAALHARYGERLVPARANDPLDARADYLDRERAALERVAAAAGPDDLIVSPNFQSPVSRDRRRARLVNFVHDVQFLQAPRFFDAPQFAALVGQFQFTRDHADAIAFVSETSRAQFNGFFGAAPRDRVVPPVIPAPSGSRPAVDRENLLLAVAHQDHHPHKNIEGLVALFADLAARDPTLCLVMTGRGGARVEARLAALPPAVRVRARHAGFVPRADLERLFDRAYALVSLSFFEGFNMPAAEAAIRGTPLVLSDLPVHRELFGDRALLVDPAAPDVDRVGAFLRAPPKRAPWPHAARCTPDAVVGSLEQLLEPARRPARARPSPAQPTILFAEELGGGFGHIVRLIAVARHFPAARRVFALRTPALTGPAVTRALGPDVVCLAAPDFPGRRADQVGEHTMADILRNCGFAEPDALAGSVGRWRVLVDGCRPDLVVSDYAPSVRVAVAGYRPHLAVGNAFSVVPDVAPLPPFRPGDDAGAHPGGSEAAILAAANAVRARVGLPPLRRAATLLGGDRTFCTSLPLLDPFVGRRETPALAPLDSGRAKPGPPVAQREGPHVFCYLDAAHVATNAVLSALNRLGRPAEVYVRGFEPARLAQHCAPHVGIHTVPADLATVLPRTRLAIHAGTLGTATAALTAGTPQIVIPDTLERELAAEALGRAGVAARLLVAPDADPDRVAAAIARVLESPELAARAAAAAHANAPATGVRPDAVIAAAARELMGGPATPELWPASHGP